MKLKITIIGFIVSVLLLTRLDFLVNNILYGFGLTFGSWYLEYQILYFWLYQVVIFLLYGYTKNIKLFAFFEVFVLTSTQDLVYFALWEGSFPLGNWNWMLLYNVLGFWNTVSQICLSLISFTVTAILLRRWKLVNQK